MRAALYLRVSTKKQDIDPQRNELLTCCKQRGLYVIDEYSDTISGSVRDRPGLDRMLADAKAHRFDCIMVVKIDRLARSLIHFIQLTTALENIGVALIVPGQGIDTSDQTPCGRLQRQMLAAFAEFERELIRSRVNAGIAVAKANGVRLGKPSTKLVPDWKDIIQSFHAERCNGSVISYRGLANELGGVSVSTAYKLANATL